MADPRAVFNQEGVDFNAETWKYDSTVLYDATKSNGSASAGLAVAINGNGQCTLTVDGSSVLGKLLVVESDGFCTVQTEGVCSLPAGNGATVTAGTVAVGALGAASAKGYIRNAVAATAAETVARDARILDASDSTNVAVELR